MYRCTFEALASILHSGFLHEKKEKVTGTWKSPTHVALHWYTHWLINHSTEPKQGREFLCFRKERKKEKEWKDGRKKQRKTKKKGKEWKKEKGQDWNAKKRENTLKCADLCSGSQQSHVIHCRWPLSVFPSCFPVTGSHILIWAENSSSESHTTLGCVLYSANTHP